MSPLLEIAKDKEVHRFLDACNSLAKSFGITDDELLQRLPSGRYPVFKSRVGWAKTYLTKACLLESSGRGNFKITKRGLDALASQQTINSKFLFQFPEFLAFQQKSNSGTTNQTNIVAPQALVTSSTSVVEERTPDELLQSSFQRLRQTLADDLLDQVKSASPAFFEKLVIDLLVAMGYGGTGKGTARVTGRSGDGGIDGIIHEDRLGFGTIYIQAKRWSGAKKVSPADLRDFIGALGQHSANKGVFITTSSFSDAAKASVKNVQSAKIVLIDGEDLAEYLVEHNVGVQASETYVLKKVDLDYFSED